DEERDQPRKEAPADEAGDQCAPVGRPGVEPLLVRREHGALLAVLLLRCLLAVLVLGCLRLAVRRRGRLAVGRLLSGVRALLGVGCAGGLVGVVHVSSREPWCAWSGLTRP